MSAQEKLALGLSLFVALFVIAFLIVPASAYHEYFADLKRRKRGRIVKTLLAGVFALSLPYFYDELVGFDSPRVSVILEVTVGACAYLVLIDVAWFIYQHIVPPAGRSRGSRR